MNKNIECYCLLRIYHTPSTILSTLPELIHLISIELVLSYFIDEETGTQGNVVPKLPVWMCQIQTQRLSSSRAVLSNKTFCDDGNILYLCI